MTLSTPPSGHGIAESTPMAQVSEREVRLQVQPDSFLRRFVKLNQLDQVSHLLFPPGTLFNDSRQWWGSKNMRPQRHEGIDIYLMQNIEMQTSTVLPQMLIPAVLPGHLVHFHRDFLGETLYIRHPEMRQEGAVLHTLYAHIHAGTALSCPSRVNRGQIVGTISPPPAAGPVPAHLHISCAWIDEDRQVEELNWERMSISSDVIFIDPLPFLLD